jgi:hypothetical protein
MGRLEPANRHGGPDDLAGAPHGDERQRRAGVPLGQQLLLPCQKRLRIVVAAKPSDLHGGRVGQELGLIDTRAQPGLDDVLADRAEEQQAAQEAEDDDEERRHEADEDVAEDQLPPDAPEQPALGEPDGTDEQRDQARQQRERPGRPQDVHDEVIAEGVGERDRRELHDGTGEDGACRPAGQDRPHAGPARQGCRRRGGLVGAWRRGWHGAHGENV